MSNIPLPVEMCEYCIHYKMIDSGYGQCRRFPPQWVVKWKWFKSFSWFPWFRQEMTCIYPEVTWDAKVCGEYDSEEKKKK